MKLVTLRRPDGTTSVGRLEGDDIVELGYGDVGELLALEDAWLDLALADGPTVSAADADLRCPILAPSKIICVGLNYLRHVREAGGDVPEFPTLFAKYEDALLGPNDALELPAGSECVDWEAELVVVVGKTVRSASESDAAAAIAGFTVGNDVSMRDWQMRTTQWLAGKSWQASSPVGPVVVTQDDVGGARPDLAIRCSVDDEVVQDSRTSDLLFDPVDLVRYASEIMTLRPGDLVFTGTPDGVGMVRQPPRYLQPGQVMTTEIERIGSLVNPVRATSETAL